MQSVIFASLCIIVGVMLYMMGLIGDLIATNRKLLERVDVRLKRIEHERNEPALGTSATPLRTDTNPSR